jgi:hypothetical protein
MLSGCDVVACLFLVFLAVCKLNCNSLLLIKYFLNLETDILRVNDHSTHDGVTTQTHTEYNLEESDFVRVLCKTSKGEMYVQ